VVHDRCRDSCALMTALPSGWKGFSRYAGVEFVLP
jgi:hypothetical protein